MKNLTKPAVAVVACLFLFVSVQAIQSQEKGKKADAGKAEAKKDAPKEVKKEAPKEEKKEAGKRLPRFYGQLNLNDEQKQKVYAIQDKYEPQIAELQTKIRELRKKSSDESMAVLTDEQKKILASVVARGTGNRDNSKEAKGSESPLKKKGSGKKISETIEKQKEEKAEKK